MISPETVNPLTLPSVLLEDRSQLPSTPCIYFAIDSQGVIQYIGQSMNLKKRWKQHHNQKSLELCSNVKIAYLDCPRGLLAEVEAALINWFHPPLNGGEQGRPGRPQKHREGGAFRLTAYLSKDLYSRMKHYTAAQNLSISEFVESLIERFLDEQEDSRR